MSSLDTELAVDQLKQMGKKLQKYAPVTRKLATRKDLQIISRQLAKLKLEILWNELSMTDDDRMRISFCASIVHNGICEAEREISVKKYGLD